MEANDECDFAVSLLITLSDASNVVFWVRSEANARLNLRRNPSETPCAGKAGRIVMHSGGTHTDGSAGSELSS
eukprot:scaffold151720_cov39-Tisochrysis_lutea.AAC.4